MPGELAYDPATGQLVYSPATGQLALNCMEYGRDCAYCPPGKTPKFFTLTFAGILPCDDPPPAWFATILAALNDTHVLEQAYDLTFEWCWWEKRVDSVSGNCGYWIVLYVGASGWKVIASVCHTDADRNNTYMFGTLWFPIVCLTGVVGQANNYGIGSCVAIPAACDTTSAEIGAYAGDVDIDPGDTT